MLPSASPGCGCRGRVGARCRRRAALRDPAFQLTVPNPMPTLDPSEGTRGGIARVALPPRGAHTALRTRCVDTGPEGDPNPEMILANIVSGPRSLSPAYLVPTDKRPPAHKRAPVHNLEKSAPQFVVTFTEDKNWFYINGQKFAPDADPMVRVQAGSYQHWHIVNEPPEIHPFHIHQVHFFAYAENGVRLANPAWLDTVNVPYGGSVDVIMDFTDPVIRGMSVFHYHLLNHLGGALPDDERSTAAPRLLYSDVHGECPPTGDWCPGQSSQSSSRRLVRRRRSRDGHGRSALASAGAVTALGVDRPLPPRMVTAWTRAFAPVLTPETPAALRCHVCRAGALFPRVDTITCGSYAPRERNQVPDRRGPAGDGRSPGEWTAMDRRPSGRWCRGDGLCRRAHLGSIRGADRHQTDGRACRQGAPSGRSRLMLTTPVIAMGARKFAYPLVRGIIRVCRRPRHDGAVKIGARGL
jgi:hypothetical protein